MINLTENEYKRIYTEAYVLHRDSSAEACDRRFVALMAEAKKRKKYYIPPDDCRRTSGSRRIDGESVRVEVRK